MTEPTTDESAPAAPDTLPDALARHGIELPKDQVKQLTHYCKLLWAWNEQLNLTRHTDFEKFVARDLVDTLQLAALLKPEEEVLDVGSGNGVPGIVLAIIRPDVQMALCESVGKKAQVLDDLVTRLKLPVAVYHGRAEDVVADMRFDTLVARAVGPLWKMLHWFTPHWASIGRMLAIKGPKWTEERGEARHRGYLNKVELRCVATYPMPGTESSSVILKLWPKGAPER